MPTCLILSPTANPNQFTHPSGQIVSPPAGWARLAMDGERDAEGRRTHGYTLRRERLDPILRQNAANTPGVTMRLDPGLSRVAARGWSRRIN